MANAYARTRSSCGLRRDDRPARTPSEDPRAHQRHHESHRENLEQSHPDVHQWIPVQLLYARHLRRLFGDLRLAGAGCTRLLDDVRGIAFGEVAEEAETEVQHLPGRH